MLNIHDFYILLNCFLKFLSPRGDNGINVSLHGALSEDLGPLPGIKIQAGLDRLLGGQVFVPKTFKKICRKSGGHGR